ncbi:MAG: pullulanase-type alpha-1,6-glucosidase, partial [bacterium]|nr:pullulanase-type alpha-1,6-glucosidase [bacterium]
MRRYNSFLKISFISLFLLLFTAITIIAQEEAPTSVGLFGSVQVALGCEESSVGCATSQLTYDETFMVWRSTFELPAGSYTYKAILNDNPEMTYGKDGEFFTLEVGTDSAVEFIYDNATQFVSNSLTHPLIVAPGTFQSELGCAGDWAPDCLLSRLQDPDGDGVYVFVTDKLEAGDYEGKVALFGTWDVNYGADAEAGGANIPFFVETDFAPVAFVFNSADNVFVINTDGSTEPGTLGGGTQTGGAAGVVNPDPRPLSVEQPEMVVIPGTIQSVVGCEADWQPDGACTALTYDETQDIWSGTFTIPAGAYEYKVAINGAWDENYGVGAEPGGANIPLSLEEETVVTFYYDHFTHWVFNSAVNTLVVAPGSFQSELGCPEDWSPDCLRSWMQDPDGDGIYVFATTSIPVGDYEVKAAIGGTWDVNYGADGVAGGANIPFSVTEEGQQVNFAYNSFDNNLYIGVGEPVEIGRVVSIALDRSQAHWVTANTLAWKVSTTDMNFGLYYSATGGIEAEDNVLVGGEMIPLTLNDAGLDEATLAKFPHLTGFSALTISEADLALVPEILKGQVVIAAMDANGALVNATSLQIPGVLDDLFTYNGTLGMVWDGDVPTISVWAPTAKYVKFHLFADSDPNTESTVLDMTNDPATGVWSITGDATWKNQYYLYEVQVFAPSVSRVVTNLVTDPYSRSLSMNSTRSQIVDVNDPTLMPPEWLTTEKPALGAPEESVVYEVHIRDFSRIDPLVPEDLIGTYKAFTLLESTGMQHLKALADAGLTHLHLLPSFDIATIDENRANWQTPSFEELASFPPDSEEQQALIDATRDLDGFNWGYDPYHFDVPEGSYSTNPDGFTRIIEYREMVQAINNIGLRVVVDVVYNHTNSAGQSEKSVFDRIVPGYYHRLDENGRVATSTCCQNTATEHNMMEKFMVDSVVYWATAYRIDAFRFDLMGHHMVSNMAKVRAALDALTLEADGVDGKAIYIYGEGWNFGEVANNARGLHATQINLAGTGIGTFNDRLRDAVRGGSPFSGKQLQGFINGLYTDPNGITPGSERHQRNQILVFADQIRVGMAGNLAGYTFTDYRGNTVTGADIDYNGQPTGYTLDPQENIVYISKHDNETLWDAIQYKAPATADVAQRVRMNNLGVSIVMFSQGVPFFHAGDDLLRSKSLDRDSYNSSDWFNRLDFTMQTNNFGVGLPPSSRSDWGIIQPLLANPDIQVTPDDIMAAHMHFREALQIRQSSPLFHLQTAEDVQARL